MTELAYTCTGHHRGEHPARDLIPQLLPSPRRHGKSLEIKCDECGLNLRLGESRRQQITDAGILTLDISLL